MHLHNDSFDLMQLRNRQYIDQLASECRGTNPFQVFEEGLELREVKQFWPVIRRIIIVE